MENAAQLHPELDCVPVHIRWTEIIGRVVVLQSLLFSDDFFYKLQKFLLALITFTDIASDVRKTVTVSGYICFNMAFIYGLQ